MVIFSLEIFLLTQLVAVKNGVPRCPLQWAWCFQLGRWIHHLFSLFSVCVGYSPERTVLVSLSSSQFIELECARRPLFIFFFLSPSRPPARLLSKPSSNDWIVSLRERERKKNDPDREREIHFLLFPDKNRMAWKKRKTKKRRGRKSYPIACEHRQTYFSTKNDFDSNRILLTLC